MSNLYISSNISSLAVQRNLRNVSSKVNDSLEKLSTGFRLNKAADGAGDIAIANSLETLQRGSQIAISNITLGQSVLGIADGALQNINGNLQRLRELALEGLNGTVDTTQANGILQEASALTAAITSLATSTNYNGTNLIGGSSPSSYNIQIGAKAADVLDIKGALGDARASALLGVVTIASSTGATGASAIAGGFAALLTAVDSAIDNLNGLVAKVGEFQNKLGNAAAVANSYVENYGASLATIRNIDIASETSKLTQNQVIQQAGASVLAQANQLPSLALRLLQ